MKQKDGFKGEISASVPKVILDIIEDDSYMRQLYITDIGYYPQAANHYRERPEPIGQHILIMCRDGKGRISAKGRTFELCPGQAFIIPAGTPHVYGADKDNPWTIFWVHFAGELSAAATDAVREKVIGCDAGSGVGALSDRLLQLFAHQPTVENLRYACSAFHHFLGMLRHCSNSQGAPGNNLEDDAVARLTKHIERNIDSRFTLDSLARFCGCSPSYLNTIFTARTGMAPVSYCNLLKARHACHLLDTTDLKLNQICFRIGISDPYYFSRFFSKIMGMSPRAYRQRPLP